MRQSLTVPCGREAACGRRVVDNAGLSVDRAGACSPSSSLHSNSFVAHLNFVIIVVVAFRSSHILQKKKKKLKLKKLIRTIPQATHFRLLWAYNTLVIIFLLMTLCPSILTLRITNRTLIINCLLY